MSELLNTAHRHLEARGTHTVFIFLGRYCLTEEHRAVIQGIGCRPPSSLRLIGGVVFSGASFTKTMLRGTGAAVGDAIFLQPCNQIAVDASDPKARIYFPQHTLWELSLALLPPVPGRCLEFCTTYVLCQSVTRLIAICCQGAQTRHFISHLHFPAPCSGTA